MHREEYRGSLWKKESSKGNTYYSGKLKIGDKEYQVSLFKNNKTNEKQPDLNIIVRDSINTQPKQESALNEPKNSVREDNTKTFEDFGKQFYVDEITLDDFMNENVPF